MPLPSPSVPTYELDIPSTGKKIKYRPFLVKEEKLLLITMQAEPELPDQINGILFRDLPSEVRNEIVNEHNKEIKAWHKEVKDTVKNLLKNCILSRIKIEDLSNFDLEYIFLQIRAVSSGEDVNMRVTCRDDGETEVTVRINLAEVKVDKPENHTNKIMLSDDLGMIMKYPGLDQFVDITLLNKSIDDTEELFDMLASCVDQIFQGEEVWDSSDTPHKEIVEFIEGMTQKQFEKLQEFFTTMPVLRHSFDVTNPNTGVTNTYTIEGLQAFFG